MARVRKGLEAALRASWSHLRLRRGLGLCGGTIGPVWGGVEAATPDPSRTFSRSARGSKDAVRYEDAG